MTDEEKQELAAFDLKHDRDKLRQRYSNAIASLPNYKRAEAWEYVACLERLVVLQRRAIEAQSTESIARVSDESLKLSAAMVVVPMRRTLESDLHEDR